MAKYTIEELYRGDKYSILSAVGAKAIRSDGDSRAAGGVKEKRIHPGR